MQLPLTLQLKPSPTLLAVLTSGHILAGVAVLFLPLAWQFIAGLLMLLAASLRVYWQRHQRRLPCLVLEAEGRLLWREHAQAEVVLCTVSPATIVLPWLVILHGRDLVPLVVFPDALTTADGFRQLCVWLRWCAKTTDESARPD